MKSREKFSLVNELLKKDGVGIKKQQKVLRNVHDKLEKERTMKLSVKEGSNASAMSGFGDTYINPYALALNANNAQIGFLSAFTGLVPPFSQIIGSKLMEKYPRRKIIVTFVTFQALMWLPILLLSLFFWKNFFTSNLPIILIVFYSIYAVLGAIAGPSWFSLMGDIVPEKIRGRYFGRRNKVAGTVGLVSLVIAAFLLDYFKTKGIVLVGFAIIFSLACIFRLISASLFSRHHEPKFKLEKGYYFSFWQFIKKAPNNNFGKFVIFVALVHLAAAIAGPFFTVYMLKDLGFSYKEYMLVNVVSAVSSLLFMGVGGKIADKYGSRELLKLGSMIIPFMPVLWILSRNHLYIILVPQILGGVGWAAFGLAASNFIYDSVTPQRRAICVSYYNILVGIGVFLGASIGGLIAQYLTITFMNKLLFIFLISGIIRLIFIVSTIGKIKEVKQGVVPRKNPFLYMKEFHPLKEIRYAIIDDAKEIESEIKDGI